MKTGGKRLETMFPLVVDAIRGGQTVFIDAYNQRVYTDAVVCITTRFDSCNHYTRTILEDEEC